MPELPEVETIRNELKPHLIGHKFTEIIIYDSKLILQPSIEEFCRKLMGQTIADIRRRGKYLIINLANGKSLVIHLRMTGALLLNSETAGKHVRAVFKFDNGNCLTFFDVRRLGVMWLNKGINYSIPELGPEPLSDDFSVDILAKRLKGRKAPIKAVLLDQSVIAGIGNMYADEALFNAGIHPMKTAGGLSSEETKKLHNAIVEVIKKAIGNKGASVANYKRPGGEPGTAHKYFKVAHQRGKPCPVCGELIQRIAVRNRGSYFCPNCQEE